MSRRGFFAAFNLALAYLGGAALAVIALVVVVLVFLVVPAHGQGAFCGQRGEIAVLLAGAHKEKLVIQGLDDTGALLEIYAKADGATWTLTRVSYTGRACIVLAGRGLEVKAGTLFGRGL